MVSLKPVLAELRALKHKQDGRVYISEVDSIAKRVGPDHALCVELWETADYNARLLATRIADPQHVTEKLVERWLPDLDSWDMCDGFCAAFVRPAPFAVAKCHEWADRKPEFEKRAAFATMAQLAWQKNNHKDKTFRDFLPLVENHAVDDRFYVKKSLNWALRDIGKRNENLRPAALAVAQRLRESGDKTAQWVGRHRIKEIML